MIDLDRLRRSAQSVYLATEEMVADDLSLQMRQAADEIEYLRAAKPSGSMTYEVQKGANALPALKNRDDATFDRAWTAVRYDPELEGARERLSVHELRLIIRHCTPAKTRRFWPSGWL